MRAASSPDNEVQGGFCVPKGAGGTQGSFPRSCAGSQSTEWGQPGPRKGLEKSKPLIALDTAHPAAGKVQVTAILAQHPQLQDMLHGCLAPPLKD